MKPNFTHFSYKLKDDFQYAGHGEPYFHPNTKDNHGISFIDKKYSFDEGYLKEILENKIEKRASRKILMQVFHALIFHYNQKKYEINELIQANNLNSNSESIFLLRKLSDKLFSMKEKYIDLCDTYEKLIKICRNQQECSASEKKAIKEFFIASINSLKNDYSRWNDLLDSVKKEISQKPQSSVQVSSVSSPALEKLKSNEIIKSINEDKEYIELLQEKINKINNDPETKRLFAKYEENEKRGIKDNDLIIKLGELACQKEVYEEEIEKVKQRIDGFEKQLSSNSIIRVSSISSATMQSNEIRKSINEDKEYIELLQEKINKINNDPETKRLFAKYEENEKRGIKDNDLIKKLGELACQKKAYEEEIEKLEQRIDGFEKQLNAIEAKISF